MDEQEKNVKTVVNDERDAGIKNKNKIKADDEDTKVKKTVKDVAVDVDERMPGGRDRLVITTVVKEEQASSAPVGRTNSTIDASSVMNIKGDVVNGNGRDEKKKERNGNTKSRSNHQNYQSDNAL